MCDRETIISPAKKMEALSSVKMTVENCLGTINMCLFWISLTMETLSAGLTAIYGCTSDRLWISPDLALSVLSLTNP